MEAEPKYMSGYPRTLLLIVLLLLSAYPATAKPGERRLNKDLNVGEILAEGNLRLNRLFLAVAATDYPLLTSELDATAARYTLLKQKLRASGPAWNTPEAYKAFGYVDKAIDFAKFMVEVRYGSATDLQARVDDFLNIPELLPEQKIGLLIAASKASYRRGQITQAQQFVKAAEELAALGETSPVALFNLRTTTFQTRGFEKPDSDDLQAGFRHAWQPLESYQTRQNPLHDADWLLAREAGRYWIEQLSELGPDGVDELLTIYGKSVEMKDSTAKWDAKLFEQMGFKFPFAGYVRQIAELSVLAAAVDQIVSTAEALPSDKFEQNGCREKLAEIESLVATAPVMARTLCNDKLDPTLATFELGEGGLIQELKGRGLFLKASFAAPEQRAELVGQGLEALLESDNRPVQVLYLFKAADLFKQAGQPSKAWEALDRALSISTKTGLTAGILDACERMATESLEAENFERVTEFAQLGLDTIQQALPYVANDSVAARQLANRSHRLSALLARASLALNDTGSALAALDMADGMSAAASQMNVQDQQQMQAVKEKKKKVVVLTAQVETLKELPPSATRDALLKENEKLLADCKADFLSESRRIREENPELYSSVLRFDPLDLPDVQNVIPADSVVVQYFPTESTLYIFLVTQDSFTLRSVELESRLLDQKVVSLLSQVTTPAAEQSSLNAVRRELYDALIGPIETDIESKQTLVLMPAGRLNFLPFSVLLDGQGKPLVESKLLLELAKPTDFLRISSSSARPIENIVAYANATLDLPAAASEGETVTALFEGSELFVGEQATKENFFSRGAAKDVLHLATHGELDMADALKSHLKMANGQTVSQQDIFEMDLSQTALVTLSACNTAISQRHDVDFVASLAEAFWIAGSRSVIATLWSVDDDSTGLLMTEFYRGLKAGKAKSDALRLAQLSVRNDPRFEHPYYWGGVKLFGDWR